MSTDYKTTTSVDSCASLKGELDEVCACCGIAGVDDVKLKICDGGCDLVKYCGDKCQLYHREQHEQECKNRVDELHDKHLFTQPNSNHWGECPLCFLPLSIYANKSILMSCCCKFICKGCWYTNRKREREQGLEVRCAFCRNPIPESDEQAIKQLLERINKHNDPVAMARMGGKHDHEGDYGKALEYYTKAAELGHVDAHCRLATLYYKGIGVAKDEKKAIYHFEQAAIGGHSYARYNLAFHEKKNGRLNRASKHYIIAANLGHDASLKVIKNLFIQGVVSKEDYAAALRGYQTVVEATKSPQREEAEAYYARS